jgi:hypothetical protein
MQPRRSRIPLRARNNGLARRRNKGAEPINGVLAAHLPCLGPDGGEVALVVAAISACASDVEDLGALRGPRVRLGAGTFDRWRYRRGRSMSDGCPLDDLSAGGRILRDGLAQALVVVGLCQAMCLVQQGFSFALGRQVRCPVGGNLETDPTCGRDVNCQKAGATRDGDAAQPRNGSTHTASRHRTPARSPLPVFRILPQRTGTSSE